MQQKQIKLLGFTLVELIVVITIVGILSTVGFVSYSGYLSSARDSNRISQLTKLSDSLQVYSASKTLPLPDNKIDITASGTLIAYQGEVGVDVLETIDYTNGGKDPKDDSYYTYYLTKDRNSLQLMALMEEQSSTAFNLTTNTNAISYEDRFPKVYGRKLGILTYNDESNPELFNTPAHLISANAAGLDIVTTPVSYTAHISDERSDKLSGTGGTIMASSPKASCKRIKQTGGGGDNGVYIISPFGDEFQAYCDMETAGGGWTMIASQIGNIIADKGSIGTVEVLPGTESQVLITETGFGQIMQAAMICSIENCWTFTISEAYRDCLVNSCFNLFEDRILKRVSGTTGEDPKIAGRLRYGYSEIDYSYFGASSADRSSGAGSNYSMDGLVGFADFTSGDKWEMYIK